MQKAIGMGIIVLALWTAVELFTKGPAGAFGGAFAVLLDEEEREADYTWAPERAGNKLRESHQERAEAIERMTGE
ncbi:MAG: hypothetical protein ABFS41_05960 [Myxococcota bacterium]